MGVDRIVIGVGSSNAEPSQENPLGVSDRKELIRASLDIHFPEQTIDIIEIPDFATDQEWTDYIMKSIQPTHIISGNEWTKECFAEQGVTILTPVFDQAISATQIRQAWREGKLEAVKSFLDPHVLAWLGSHIIL